MFNCLICNNSTSEVSFNNRILKYICEDCDKLYIIRIYDRYHPNKSEMVMMLNDSVNAAGKSFINRNKKYAIMATQIKTVIPQV